MNKLQDVHAEKAVLAGLFNYGLDAWIDISDIIQQSKTFTVKHNEHLYLCLEHAFSVNDVKIPDIASIYTSAQSLGLSEFVNEKTCSDHINQVIEFDVNRNNLRHYAAVIRKLHIGDSIRRKLKEIDYDISNITGEERISEIFGKIEEPILELTNTLSEDDDEPKPLGQYIQEYITDKLNNPVDQVGISTGMPRFDRAVGGGLRAGSVNVIGARSKGFKSGLALNAGLHIASLNTPVLYIDTELQDKEQIPRALASRTSISIDNIETGQFKESEDLVRGVGDKIKTSPIDHKNIAGKPFEEQLAIMRRWLYKRPGLNLNGKANPCVIIYDYIKLMDTNSISDAIREHQAIGFIVTSLHNFAVKYNIPIFTFVQLNRDGIDKESTAAISQSDRILWYCSNFSIFKPKSMDEISHEEERGILNAGNFKLIPMACRHGKGLQFGDYINFQVTGDYFQIIEKKKHSENLYQEEKQPSNTVIELEDDERIAF